MSELIYHYVKDFSVLQEFLKDDAQIFATHRLFFVDTEEGKEALRFANDSLVNESFYEKIPVDLRENLLMDIDNQSIYVFSLSTAEDDKPLWKEHSTPNGFAIGFDKELLENAMQGERVYLSDGILINEISKAWFIVAGHCRYSHNFKFKFDDFYKDKFSQDFIKYLNLIFCKDKKWKKEQEYRLFLHLPPGEGLRFEQIIGDKPRISIPMKFGVKLNSLIKRIFIAPSCDITRKRQKHLLQQLLCKMSVTGIDFEYSKYNNDIWEKE